MERLSNSRKGRRHPADLDDALVILSLKDLTRMGFGSSFTIKRMIARGAFPRPFRLSDNSREDVWRKRDILAFVEKQKAKRRPPRELQGAVARRVAEAASR
jgi:predicted DNA-binding transcriptional regulator AlpA